MCQEINHVRQIRNKKIWHMLGGECFDSNKKLRMEIIYMYTHTEGRRS